MKSRAYCTEDCMYIEASYQNPYPHRHYEQHIIISLGDEFYTKIENKSIGGTGIVIGSNVEHTIITPNAVLVVLIDELTPLAAEVERDYLNTCSYYKLSDAIARTIKKRWLSIKEKENLQLVETAIHDIEGLLGLRLNVKNMMDKRILAAKNYMQSLSDLDGNVIQKTAGFVHLSPSRLSHLFKSASHTSFKRYLANLKLEKAMLYLQNGKSITDACMMAGFSSPSHSVVTSRKMYGMPMSYMRGCLQFIFLNREKSAFG